MTSSVDFERWPAAARVSPAEITKAREELLNLIQWLARIANSYVPGSPEERTLLEFRPAETAFVTKTFGNDLLLTLRLPSLEMQFLQNGKPVPHIFNPEGRSPAEVEAWFLVELLHRGIDREKFSKKLPYKMTGLMSGDAEDHMPSLCADGLEYVTGWIRNAGVILAKFCKGEVVCSPQTLELTCARQAGFGFALGDAITTEPFFYAMRTDGNGSGAGQKRAILSASALLAKPDPTTAALEFLKA